MTPDYREILMAMYRAFNDRDLDGTLEHFAPEVEWANAETGALDKGRLELGATFEKAWKETDLRLEPLSIAVGPDDTRARVHEFAKAADGTILRNRKLEHVFAFDGVFISRMIVDLTTLEADDDDDDDWGDGDGDGGGDG